MLDKRKLIQIIAERKKKQGLGSPQMSNMFESSSNNDGSLQIPHENFNSNMQIANIKKPKSYKFPNLSKLMKPQF